MLYEYLNRDEQYKDATQRATNLLTELSRRCGEQDATSFYWLARHAANQGDSTAAREYIRRAVEIVGADLGADSVRAIRFMGEEAAICRKFGDADRACELYGEVLQLQHKYFDLSDLQLWQTMFRFEQTAKGNPRNRQLSPDGIASETAPVLASIVYDACLNRGLRYRVNAFDGEAYEFGRDLADDTAFYYAVVRYVLSLKDDPVQLIYSRAMLVEMAQKVVPEGLLIDALWSAITMCVGKYFSELLRTHTWNIEETDNLASVLQDMLHNVFVPTESSKLSLQAVTDWTASFHGLRRCSTIAEAGGHLHRHCRESGCYSYESRELIKRSNVDFLQTICEYGKNTLAANSKVAMSALVGEYALRIKDEALGPGELSYLESVSLPFCFAAELMQQLPLERLSPEMVDQFLAKVFAYLSSDFWRQRDTLSQPCLASKAKQHALKKVLPSSVLRLLANLNESSLPSDSTVGKAILKAPAVEDGSDGVVSDSVLIGDPSSYFFSHASTSQRAQIHTSDEQAGRCGPATLAMVAKCFAKLPDETLESSTIIENMSTILMEQNEKFGNETKDKMVTLPLLRSGAQVLGLQCSVVRGMYEIDRALVAKKPVAVIGRTSRNGSYYWTQRRELQNEVEDKLQLAAWRAELYRPSSAHHVILLVGKDGEHYIVNDCNFVAPVKVHRRELEYFMCFPAMSSLAFSV